MHPAALWAMGLTVGQEGIPGSGTTSPCSGGEGKGREGRHVMAALCLYWGFGGSAALFL